MSSKINWPTPHHSSLQLGRAYVFHRRHVNLPACNYLLECVFLTKSACADRIIPAPFFCFEYIFNQHFTGLIFLMVFEKSSYSANWGWGCLWTCQMTNTPRRRCVPSEVLAIKLSSECIRARLCLHCKL